MMQNIVKLSLTAEFYSYEVLNAEIFKEDSGGERCFKEKRDVCIQLSMESRKVKVGRFLVKKCSVPEVLCKKKAKAKVLQKRFASFFSFHSLTEKVVKLFFSFQSPHISFWNKAH